MRHIMSCRKAYILAAVFVLAAAFLPFGASAQDQDKEVEKTTIIKKGDVAPDFTVEMISGEKITLSALKGKVVLVNFWATWCPPCREELSHMQQGIIDRYKGKKVVILPISRGEKRDVVEAFRKKMSYTFPMGLDPQQSIYKLYATNYIPRNFLVGKDGRVVFVSVGYDKESLKQLTDAIDKAL